MGGLSEEGGGEGAAAAARCSRRGSRRLAPALRLPQVGAPEPLPGRPGEPRPLSPRGGGGRAVPHPEASGGRAPGGGAGAWPRGWAPGRRLKTVDAQLFRLEQLKFES